MTSLWQAIASLALELHPDAVERIAAAISRLPGSTDSGRLGSCGLHGRALGLLVRILDEWRLSGGLTPGELAAALRSAATIARTIETRQSLELVWSGPDTSLVPVRKTEQVLLEVIRGAQRGLFLVSFVAYEVPSVIGALKAAIDRGVRVEALLELSQDQGGKISTDSVSMMKKAVPEATVYIWGPDGNKGGAGSASGAVHAKCAVADGEIAFVTSANLTKAAMERNMEMGILVKGGHLPEQLEGHLKSLVATRAIAKA